MAEQVRRVRQVVGDAGQVAVGGQPDGQDAEAFAADRHRQVVVDCAVLTGLSFVPFLAAEGASLRCVGDGQRGRGVLAERGERPEHRTAVVREEQMHGRGSVGRGERCAQRVHQGVRRRRANRSFDITAQGHGLSNILISVDFDLAGLTRAAGG